LKISGKWREIIGVARNITYRHVGDEPEPAMYLPLYQDYDPALTLVVRTEGSPYTVLAGVEDAASRLDSGLSLSRIESLEAHAASTLFQQRDMAFLLSAFGLLALALTAVGLNGVVAYTASQRTHEIGIRMALGAQPGDVLRLVLGQGTKPVLVGIAIGLVASWTLMRLLASLLYGVSASDPLTFIGVAALLSAVALVASYLPARRAMRVDPLVALRYE
jgi:putative ABC transport system permease protein